MNQTRTALFLLCLLFGQVCLAEPLQIWQGVPEKNWQKLEVELPADRLCSFLVRFSDENAKISLRMKLSQKFGKAQYNVFSNQNLDGKNGLEQLADDLPVFPGRYDLEIKGSGSLTTLYLQKLAACEQVQYGEALGELVVENAGDANFVARPPSGVTIKHPDFKHGMNRGIATPDGSVFFRVPAGLWTLQKSGQIKELSHLIPVHSGKSTRVRWNVVSQISLETEDVKSIRRLDIREVVADENDLLKVRFAMPPGLALKRPELEEMQLRERNLNAELIDLQSSETPIHLVLLLDSSGSMRRDMKTAIDATVKFIRLMPENARVEVVDFDHRIQPLKAKNRDELVKAVQKVKADGATALRDSIIYGLDMLKNSPRPVLVVFTDGFDANFKDTGPGSKATEKQMFEKVNAAGIPIFTIGFGKNADEDTMARIADRTGGIYQAASSDTIDSVFATLQQTVAQEYTLTCRRPARAGKGMRPVVALTVDTSGSMSSSIEKDKPGSRRATANAALHGAIDKMPEDILLQVVEFSSDVGITQTMTSDKARMHRGITSFTSGGGTNVLLAVKTALEGLLSVPSRRRILFLLTDEAIKMSPEKQKAFDRMLDRMKDEQIFSIWVGMVSGARNDDFKKIADRAGGTFLISENIESLEKTVKQLIEKVSEPVDDTRIPIELVWQMPVADSNPQPVSGSGIFELPPVKVVADGAESQLKDTLEISFSEISGSQPVSPAKSSGKRRAKSSGSAKSSAAAKPDSDKTLQQPSVSRMVIPLEVNGQNEACSFAINGMELFDSINGIKAPDKHVFVAISLELKNILPEQDVVISTGGSSHPAKWVGRPGKDVKVVKAIPPYLIKDLRQHMFIRWNGSVIPCSPVSWLFEDSLAPFGRFTLKLDPDQSLSGRIAFIVPDDSGLTEGAVDYFDTSYGNLSLTLAGTPESSAIKTTPLPKKVGKNLGNAFRIDINGFSDHAGPLAGALPGDQLLYRVIDFTLDSQVQALLNIEPSTRMFLEIATEKGPVRRPLSPATSLLPGGFFTKTMLAPGSANHFRQAYLLPQELAEMSSGALRIELKGDDAVINLNDAPVVKASETAWHAEGNGLKIRINSHGKVDSLHNRRQPFYMVDLTVADDKDGSATRLQNLLYLESPTAGDTGAAEPKKSRKGGLGSVTGGKGKKRSSSASADAKIRPDAVNESLMFGVNSEAVVPDGEELRLIAVFRLGNTSELFLKAEGMPLNLKIHESAPEIPEWLKVRNEEKIPSLPDRFEKDLAARLKQLSVSRNRDSAGESPQKIVEEDGSTIEIAPVLWPPILVPEAVSAKTDSIAVEIYLFCEPVADSAAAQTSKASSALGGKSSSVRRFRLLQAQLPADQVCKTPFEIRYFAGRGEKGKQQLKAVVSGIFGDEDSSDFIDLDAWKPVRESISFKGKGLSWPIFERDVSRISMENRIHSVAALIPDIDENAAFELAEEWTGVKSENSPEHTSLWRWYAHSRIARFIADQTAFEKESSRLLHVSLSRENTPRLMVLTGGMNEAEKFEARLDLLSVFPEVKGDDEAARSFRITSGLFVSDLEAQVMSGRGVFQFWGKNTVHIIPDKGAAKNNWLKFAAKAGVGDSVIEAIKKSKSIIMFPDNSAVLNGRPFWSWIEVDPVTYELKSVLETGERGTIAGEAIIKALIPDGAALTLGFFKGVESSIWGVSAFIVGGDSYEVALEKTRILMGYLVKGFGEIKSSPSIDIPGTDASIDFTTGHVSLSYFSTDGTVNPWEGYKGFTSGFKMGMEYYLDLAGGNN